MKKIFLLIIFICSITNIYSQNIFNLVKPTRNIFRQIKYPITIQRITIVETSRIESALTASIYESQLRHQEQLFRTDMINQRNTTVAYLSQNIKQFQCKPEKLYGGYNYLKTCSSVFSKDILKQVTNKETYNGIHHIINISTIKELYKESLQNYNLNIITNYPFLQDMILNAPALFHQYHNHPSLSNIFHNKEVQLSIYESEGIKGILDVFFKNINTANKIYNLEPISDDIIIGTYLEAKVWCDAYGLKWE